MPELFPVELGGATYMVAPLPIRPSRKWREQLESQLAGLLDVVASAGSFELNTTADLETLFAQVVKPFLHLPDTVLDLVCGYSPELNSHRDTIENTAYDTELVAAFVAIVKVVYPVGEILGLAKGMGKKAKALPQQ